MATRTKRSFNEFDRKELLQDLKNCRDACVRTCTKAPIHGGEYKAASKLLIDIDKAAEALTGKEDYFRLPSHST